MSTSSGETECPKCGGVADYLYDLATRDEEIWCRTCGHFVNGTLLHPCSPTNIPTKNTQILPEDDQNPGGVDGPFSVPR